MPNAWVDRVLSLLRSPSQPDIGWGRPILMVLGAIVIPALVGAAFVVATPMDTSGTYNGADAVIWFVWRVAACLTVAPLFIVVILPLAVPLVWVALRFGHGSLISLILIANVLGLPAAHIVLNGDLTTEAPEMIPVLCISFTVQALVGYLVLKFLQRRKKKVVAE